MQVYSPSVALPILIAAAVVNEALIEACMLTATLTLIRSHHIVCGIQSLSKL